MKAPAYTLPRSLPDTRVNPKAVAVQGAEITKQVFKWSLASIPGAAIMVLALWVASTPSAHDIYSAAIWAAGFVFIALAVDAPMRQNLGLLMTGVALPILGFLGSRIAIEFSVLATLLVAVWIAVGLLRRGSAAGDLRG